MKLIRDFLIRPIGSLALFTLIVGFFFFVNNFQIIQRTRSRRRPPCLNNLHLLVLAIQNSAATHHDELPQPTFGSPAQSWRVAMLPLLDNAALYRRYQHDQPWDAPANEEFARTKIPVFLCPDNSSPTDGQGRYRTSYALLTGPSTAFEPGKSATWDDFSDGVSKTILIVEACGANIVWNEPRDMDVSQSTPGVELLSKSRPVSQAWLSGYHSGFVTVAFADGSVRSLPSNIDPEILQALATPNGGEQVDANAY